MSIVISHASASEYLRTAQRIERIPPGDPYVNSSGDRGPWPMLTRFDLDRIAASQTAFSEVAGISQNLASDNPEGNVKPDSGCVGLASGVTDLLLASLPDEAGLPSQFGDLRSSAASALLRVSAASVAGDPLRFFRAPLHVLASDANLRADPKRICRHLWRASLFRADLCNLFDDVVVCGPEVSFVQVATQASIPQLVQFGCELTGTYALQPWTTKGFSEREPLTTVEELRSLVDRIGRVHGLENARRALRYVVPRSASPMETVLVLALCLPVALGGYGLPAPLLNHRIDVAPWARDASGKLYYVCDLFWPDVLLIVEYDSDMFHTGADRIANDAIRRNALTFMGMTVITVTRRQLLNPVELDRVAHVIAKGLGKRLREQGEDGWRKRRDLMDQLLQWSMHL